MHQKVAVLDFGGQYAHLIANRVRRLGVYSEILDAEASAQQLSEFRGVIISGGPQSVYGEDSPKCDPKLFELGIPVLGICYGHQLMQHTLGGKVSPGKTKEYGMAKLSLGSREGILAGLPDTLKVWMSHFDTVSELGEGFSVTATTADCPIAAVADPGRNFYGIQFHPEVTHTEQGMKILDNFLGLCDVSRDWSMEAFMEEEVGRIKRQIGDQKVSLLCSGGVDSTVCFALLEKALGPERVHGMLVDTGLMRYEEAARVKKALNEAGFTNLHVADEAERFLSALRGVSEPEAKRKIIGDLFWEVKESNAETLGLNPDEWIMGQGTIYPDTIETGGTKHADKIKTHHNRVDLVQEMIAAGKVIEPLAQLYKDEVRDLGERLGLPHGLVWRQPFPGPGLGVRILCASGQDVDQAVSRESEFSRLSAEITDFVRDHFSVQNVQLIVLPARSVGVQGDERTYRHPVALFVEGGIEGAREIGWDTLEEISTAVTNRWSEVNRTILALSGPSEGIALHALDTTPERVALLQRVDESVSVAMSKAPGDYGIWQFPVVLMPAGSEGHESIVLRPIVSTEAMTASFARIDWDVLKGLTTKITEEDGLSHVFYDLTHKPPGTIEWE